MEQLQELSTGLLSNIIQSFDTLLEDASNRSVELLRREVLSEVLQGLGVCKQDLDEFRQTADTGNSYPRSDVSPFISGVIR